MELVAPVHVSVQPADEVKTYTSAELVAEVPPGVVTVTSTSPAFSAGLVAVICESLTTVKDGEAVAPKLTAVAPVKPDPVIVTEVPPEVDPDVGAIAATTGPGSIIKLSATLVAEVPLGSMTVTSTVPEDPAGLVR